MNPSYRQENAQLAIAKPQTRLNPTQGYSDLLPSIVLNTLNDHSNLSERLEQRQVEEKTQVEKHINNCLKEIIRMFEALKLSLWAKVDEKAAQFDSLFQQLEALSLECSNWAEQKIQDVQNNFSAPIEDPMNANVHKSEKLSIHLNEIRNKKLKADAIENALLAIDQKIDAMRLTDIAEEVTNMAVQPDKIYFEQPALLVYQKIQKAVALGLKEVRMNDVIRLNGGSPVQGNQLIRGQRKNFEAPRSSGAQQYLEGVGRNSRKEGVLVQTGNNQIVPGLFLFYKFKSFLFF